MKKLKKYAIFFLCIIVIFLISINILVTVYYNTLSNRVENLTSLKSKIIVLDNFKTTIVNLGHSQKFYLLSSNESYKTKYNNYLNDAFTSINKLAEENAISDSEKETLTNMLVEYNDINLSLLNGKIQLPLTAGMQTYLSKSNEIQINVLHEISNAIADNSDTTSKNHDSIATSINSQKNIIQILSSIISVIIGGPVYSLYKKYKNGELQLDEIINILDKEKIKVDNYSNIIIFTSLLNNHNKEMKKQWIEVKEKVELLQKNINDLKLKALECSSCPDKKFFNEIQSMEVQLLEIKLIIKQLPDYHEFIVGLTDSILNNKKD